MKNRQTISDSKRVFHQAFPYVIPPIYRKVADELLVELNLLSHQQDFKLNGLFALGLSKVFDTFTTGYRPKEHLKSLFEALCTSTGFDAASIRSQAYKFEAIVQGSSIEDVQKWFSDNGQDAPQELNELIKIQKIGERYYSRLMSIGLVNMFISANSDSSKNQKELNKIAEVAAVNIGFAKERVEKDLILYDSTIEKINQAFELMNEIQKNKKP